MTAGNRQKVVIVGGGFGGLNAARGLRGAPVEVTLMDKRNFHLFQPLLYQVATGALSPGDITAPLRHVVSGQPNTHVLLGEVTGFDVERRKVLVAGTGELDYDWLVVAAGAEGHYFGHNEWQQFAPGLKSIEEATEIRRRIFLAFERAEQEPDLEERKALLRFVIVGGGPTGVELAGAISEIARDTLRGDFRRIRPEESEILLLDNAPRVLSAFTPDLSEKAERQLLKLGVRCRSGVLVTGIDFEGLDYELRGERHRIATRTVIWAAGVKPSHLGSLVAKATGAETDRSGRLLVEPDLSIPGHPEIFVIGDMAHRVQDGKPLPGLAPVAIQQGNYVARRIAGRTKAPFHYWDKGTMATIGRNAGVADLGFIRFGGKLAWLAWLFIHLMYLVGFRNRVVVLVQWAFEYITFNRGARLIIGDK